MTRPARCCRRAPNTRARIFTGTRPFRISSKRTQTELCALTTADLTRSCRSALHERPEPCQRLLPLLGHALEVSPQLLQWLWVPLEAALTPETAAAHQARALEHPQMLGDRLARQPRAVRQLCDRTRPAAGEGAYERQPRLVAQGREHRRVLAAARRMLKVAARHASRCCSSVSS